MIARRALSDPSRTVREIYRRLSLAWGPQHWWPAESPFEVVVGAFLTQNTSWTNVEKAIAGLRAAGALSAQGVRELGIHELEQLIRPSGYFRQKAKRLKEFVKFLDSRYGGSVEKMLQQPTAHIREELLVLNGIGPETADSILLYAGSHPIFVVDAYSRRVLERHEAVSANAKYDEIREIVERALQREAATTRPGLESLSENRPVVHPASAMSMMSRDARVQVLNEMHGLFVQLGKHHCAKKEPACDRCPLGDLLGHPTGRDTSRNRRARAARRQGAAKEKSRKWRV